MADITGASLKDKIESELGQDRSRVAIVGETDDFVDMFHVLGETGVKLAQPFGASNNPAVPKDSEEALGKAEPLNVVKDKKTGRKYVVDPMPSVVISITGDAQNMPEDQQLIEAVDVLLGKDEGVKDDPERAFKLEREDAMRAIAHMAAYGNDRVKQALDALKADHQQKWQKVKDKSRWLQVDEGTSLCMRVAMLLQARLDDLELISETWDPNISPQPDAASVNGASSNPAERARINLKEWLKIAWNCAHNRCVKDVLLNVAWDLQQRLEVLKTKYRFPEECARIYIQKILRETLLHQPTKENCETQKYLENQMQFLEEDFSAKPVAASKPLSKARLAKFFASGMMGAALKVSDSNRSAWIIDGGSNIGVMKMAGEAHKSFGSIARKVPLIGIAVANPEALSKPRDVYDLDGHSHLILAVDPKGKCPTRIDKEGKMQVDKEGKAQVAYGYEVEYRKLFEDSVSINCRVPIVGLLVGGGPVSLHTVLEALEGNFPMVVIKGSGRVADLICAMKDNQPLMYVKIQCEALDVDFERVKKCSEYSKLHILDLDREGPDGFVQFVEAQVSNYSAPCSDRFRSSHLTELFSFLHDPQPHSDVTVGTSTQPDRLRTFLKLIEPEQQTARWSLCFGMAQADSSESFERKFEFASQEISCIQCAKAAVHVMRLIFPLPVAIVWNFENADEALVQDCIDHFAPSVKPFCVWKMLKINDSLEIQVHFRNNHDKKEREIKCTFSKLDSLRRLSVPELEVEIANLLHKEYGIVPIAFASMKPTPEVPGTSIEAGSSGTGVGSVSDGVSDHASLFIDRIASNCLQSINTLLVAEKPAAASLTHSWPAVDFAPMFILEQSLACCSFYKEIVTNFFLDMKEELQQRIHGEGAGEICRSACQNIQQLSVMSLPLHFQNLPSTTQKTLIRYLPGRFLRMSHTAGDHDITQHEHDFDFPVFGRSDKVSEDKRRECWTAYWEYLYLNCGDNRPFAPCWDPIALQIKALDVLATLELSMQQQQVGPQPHTLHGLFEQFRSLIVEDMCVHWNVIRRAKGYSDKDTIVLMQRFERSVKKVFFFLLCCKRIVFCEACLAACLLKKAGQKSGKGQGVPGSVEQVNDVRHNYALKCSRCNRTQNSKDATLWTPEHYSSEEFRDFVDDRKWFGRNGSNKQKNTKAAKHAKNEFKSFAFGWYMTVGLNLKKACSTCMLRHPREASFQIMLGSPASPHNVHKINFSNSRGKLGEPKIEDVRVRLMLRDVLHQVVEICKSEMVNVQYQRKDSLAQQLAETMLAVIVTAKQVNKVVAECQSLKTGCAMYEPFPVLTENRKTLKYQSSEGLFHCNNKLTHLMVAAVEGNVRNADAYLAAADIGYICHYHSTDLVRSCNCINRDFKVLLDDSGVEYSSCALHMALERGNTSVAVKIIDRILTLVCGGSIDDGTMEQESDNLLARLFFGTSRRPDHCDGIGSAPTCFMYLARYAMTDAMDKFIKILQRMKKQEEMQTHMRKYVIKPTGPNGMNALHYAVLSQSPKCVEWFLPHMQDFRICNSSSKLAFVPPLLPLKCYECNSEDDKPPNPAPLESEYSQFFSMHPPMDFADSDCRLVISEDWIQTYHYSGSAFGEQKHKEMSPYELALLLWRVLELEASQSAQVVHNLDTNLNEESNLNQKPKPSQESKGVAPAICNFLARQYRKIVPIPPPAPPEKEELKPDDESEDAAGGSLIDSRTESLAYNKRSEALSQILLSLEKAAQDDTEIDAKKKKGLRQLTAYRNHRAISRMVFPVLAYLGYVMASTFMALLMTNGMMDEPTKFTHGVINELQWAPNKDVKDIASYNDLTVFWGVLAGFLWPTLRATASPLTRPFSTYNILGPVLVRQTRTARTPCIGGQAMCTPSNYRSTTFSPDQDWIFTDYADATDAFRFYDNSGVAYDLPYSPEIVHPQWGHEYFYSGGGYALSFSCASNSSLGGSCQSGQQQQGYITCRCSQRFQDLLSSPTAAVESVSSTYLDPSSRAMDVSFLIFSPSLESYVFVHLMFEFSETGTVSVWDDYVSFSGRYSKQFAKERLTVLRVSQYVTIVYALLYLFYEWEDWRVLADKLPDLFFKKSDYYGAIYQLLELIGLACGYSVIGLDLSLQGQLKDLFNLANTGNFVDPASMSPMTGMKMHKAISNAHTLLSIEREVIGAYMFFTWARVFAYLVHVPSWGPYLHAIIATIFEPIVLAFVMVVVLLNAAFTIMMYCSYAISGGDDFKTLQAAFFSMWRMLMGLNDNFSFVENNRGLSNPKFSKGAAGAAYVFLTILGNLVVMNIIVALLSERYSAIGKFSLINFNRELNTNLAKDIIAVKSSEGLNPFSFRFLGSNFSKPWKLHMKRRAVLVMMLFIEGYYIDFLFSFFDINRLNCPAVLFRVKWFHGGVAQERQVCKKLLKFANISTTPMAAASSSKPHSRSPGSETSENQL